MLSSRRCKSSAFNYVIRYASILLCDFDNKFPNCLSTSQVTMSTLVTLCGEWILINRAYLEGFIRNQIKELVAVIGFFFGRKGVVALPGAKCDKYWQGHGTWAYVGRRTLTFFSANLYIENGGIGPEAFPSATMVPLRLMSLKSLSKLEDECQML